MGDTSDLDHQIEQLRKCEVIKESDVKNLCAKAREILGKDFIIIIIFPIFSHNSLLPVSNYVKWEDLRSNYKS